MMDRQNDTLHECLATALRLCLTLFVGVGIGTGVAALLSTIGTTEGVILNVAFAVMIVLFILSEVSYRMGWLPWRFIWSQRATTVSRSGLYPAVKRLVDIIVSFVALLVLAPHLLWIALAIKLDSRGPVFFREYRVGKDGKEFWTVKFRTMAIDPGWLSLLFEEIPEDLRVTRLGRVLRNWSLNELPKLFNVLKGDMSLVGPRPVPLYEIDDFTSVEQKRMQVKPGLTGWAQVHGRNSITWKEQIQLDLWYIAHQSFWLDMIILLTAIRLYFVRPSFRHGGEEVAHDQHG